MLSVGVSAWGAESAQAAGLYRDVQLTVVNKSTRTVRVSVCDGLNRSPCPEFHNYVLHPGKTAYRTHEAVSGDVTAGVGGHPFYFDFSAQNPALDLPFIKLTPQEHGPGETKQHLSEGQLVGPLNVDFFHVLLYRGADTARVKVMSITITSVPEV